MYAGAAYCQLIDLLFPGYIHLNKVKFSTKLEHEYMNNWKLVQGSLEQVGITKVCSVLYEVSVKYLNSACQGFTEDQDKEKDKDSQDH